MKNRWIGILLSIVLICSQFTVVVEGESTSGPSSWAKVDIEALISLGEFDTQIFSGYQTNITRKEFIYVAVRLFELLWGKDVVADSKISFSDTNDSWANKGATIGITSGIGENKFGPDEYLSREQFATMIIRTLKLGELTLLEESNVEFSDEADFSNWAKASVHIAKANNIINGIGNNQFAPKELATKEQSLIIVNRIIEQFKGKEFTYSMSDGTSKIDGLGEFEDQVLVTINNAEIMLSSTNILVYQYKSYYESLYGKTVWDMETSEGVTVENSIKEELKDVTIRSEIIYDYAMKKGLFLTKDKEVELMAQAKTIFESYTPSVLTKYGFTLAQLQETLIKQEYSTIVFDETTKDVEISDLELSKELEKNTKYQALMQYGLDAFYDKVRVRHILIKTVDDANQSYTQEAYATAKNTMTNLLTRAKAGEDFARLATMYSEDPGSLDVGGEYLFGHGVMVTEFESAAYKLKVGEISEIVETQYGFHILKLEEKIPSTDQEKARANEDLARIKEEVMYTIRLVEFNEIYASMLKDYTIDVKEDVWSSMTFRDK